TVPNSSARWRSTRASSCSVTSAAPRVSLSLWPNRSADASLPRGAGASECANGSQLDVGPDEPVVPGSDPGQPVRGGFGADEAEQGRTGLGLRGVRRPVGDADFLEEVAAV